MLYWAPMTLDALIMLAGGFVLIEPQLGFPATWDRILLTCAGILIIALGIAVRRRGTPKVSVARAAESHI